MPSAPRILIVGGVAGGASAAARARRLSESADIVVFERGPYVSFANCGLPYHIGGVISDRSRLLLQTPTSLKARFAIDVRVNTEVISIDPVAQVLVARNLQTGEETREPYDALILSPGAEAIRPPIPGVNLPCVFTLRNMGDMDAILGVASKRNAQRVLIVGAGFIGLELAEQFRHRGMDVSLVERLPHVLGLADIEMTFPLHEELKRHMVDLRLGRAVAALEPDGEGLVAVLDDGDQIHCDLAVLCIGVKPEVGLARQAGLVIGPLGGIQVDDQMRTSQPKIFAVGDAVEVREWVSGDQALIPLAGPANRQGRIAAEVVLGRDSRYKATQGTAICKVFDLSFAMTGLSEATLQRKEMAYKRVYVHPADHATYYPGAHPITLKLLFDPTDGRILGAQAVGVSGVDKRMDVIAVAQRAGLTVFDLEDLELCYAPPFGSAKDPVNMAGFVASNVLRGDMTLWEPEDIGHLAEDQILVDVRTSTEFAQGTIPGSICIPLDQLRDRISTLPKHTEFLVFCQVGVRAYIASRILAQHEFKVRNLSGGYRRYTMWEGVRTIPLACEAIVQNPDGD